MPQPLAAPLTRQSVRAGPDRRPRRANRDASLERLDDAATPFSLTQQHSDDGWVIHVAGALDTTTSRLVADALGGFAGHVTLDCAGITSIDPCGQAVLASAHRRLRRTGGRLTLQGANQPLSHDASPLVLGELRSPGG